jgi:D-sedoheptulose 7-phosphate isomerase
MSEFFKKYIEEATSMLGGFDAHTWEQAVDLILAAREKGGRVFIAGVGGSAANSIHAAADFRKLSGVESYALLENIAELTAVTNDLSWESVFQFSLEHNNAQSPDLLLVFSVGGGNEEKKVSLGLISAIQYAKAHKMKTISFVGRRDGYAAQNSDLVVVGETRDYSLLTPISESGQGLFWHFLVSHPKLAVQKPVWK